MKKYSCVVSVVAILILANSAWAVQRPHRLTKLDIGVYLASEFDAATTYHVLQSCGDRCYEANPMVRPFARNLSVFAVLGGSAFAVNFLARKVESSGHGRWAKVLRVIAISAHAGAGAQNIAFGQ